MHLVNFIVSAYRVKVLMERCEHECFSLAPPLRNFIDVKTNAQMFALW